MFVLRLARKASQPFKHYLKAEHQQEFIPHWR
jgi:hypothetical protein